MTSIESKDICFPVPIHLEHQKYRKLCFLTNCNNYQFTYMPNSYGLMVQNYENFQKDTIFK